MEMTDGRGCIKNLGGRNEVLAGQERSMNLKMLQGGTID